MQKPLSRCGEMMKRTRTVSNIERKIPMPFRQPDTKIGERTSTGALPEVGREHPIKQRDFSSSHTAAMKRVSIKDMYINMD